MVGGFVVATGAVVVLGAVVAVGALVAVVVAATEAPPPPHAVSASPAVTAEKRTKDKWERISNYCIEILRGRSTATTERRRPAQALRQMQATYPCER